MNMRSFRQNVGRIKGSFLLIVIVIRQTNLIEHNNNNKWANYSDACIKSSVCLNRKFSITCLLKSDDFTLKTAIRSAHVRRYGKTHKSVTKLLLFLWKDLFQNMLIEAKEIHIITFFLFKPFVHFPLFYPWPLFSSTFCHTSINFNCHDQWFDQWLTYWKI